MMYGGDGDDGGDGDGDGGDDGDGNENGDVAYGCKCWRWKVNGEGEGMVNLWWWKSWLWW